MTRTIRRTIAFRRPFYLTGVDRLLPPGDYDVVPDEELIEGLSFSAYHRVSTGNFRACAVWIRDQDAVTIDPLDLEAALERDAASHPRRTNWASVRGLSTRLTADAAQSMKAHVARRRRFRISRI